MVKLAENRYGKSRVRLVRLNRQSAVHEFSEWNVELLLRGEFRACFEAADNSKILPTDTMKNTVYFLARNSSARCLEDFAKEIVNYLLPRNPQVSEVQVSIQEKSWEHLRAGGRSQPTAFVQSASELQTTEVSAQRGAPIRIVSGLDHLVIMKTADSAFTGYIKDSLTTLPETDDRLFGTSLTAKWSHNSAELPFPALRSKIRDALLSTFASHQSKSVQHTLYAMAKSALEASAEIDDITLTMPNKHCLLVDLSRFGLDNPNTIFVPTDEPHGTIEARVCRGS